MTTPTPPLPPPPSRTALILYATETGTSLDLAEQTLLNLEQLGLTVDIAPCDAATVHDLKLYSLCVFVVSTTGQGDFPSNSRRFWKGLLKRKLSRTELEGVRYSVLGVGDSGYVRFCWAARKLEKRLKGLGAEGWLGECDEQSEEGIEVGYEDWVGELRGVVREWWGGVGECDEGSRGRVGGRRLLEEVGKVNGNGVVNGAGDMNGSRKKGAEDGIEVELELNQRVTPVDHWQDVRLLRFRADQDIDYLPGDTLEIKPENMASDIDTLIEHMQWQDIASKPLVLVPNPHRQGTGRFNTPPIPFRPTHEHVTFRELLTKHLDINSIPRRSFFSAIAAHTCDEMHRERLLEFTEPQYVDEYFDYATRTRRSIIEVLQEFDSVRIPWQEVLNVIPALRPRQFSIASGYSMMKLQKPGEGGTVFELLVAIVKYRTAIRRIREGVCTRWLAAMPVGTKLNVSLRTEGRFSTRAELASKNHILIGAGTGIAPLRALVHEKSMQLPSNHDRSTTLVFGARNERADYFFGDEWTRFCGAGLRLDLVTAFSRDQKQKVYVQDRIRGYGTRLAKLMRDDETVVVVCGASGLMPKAVRAALADVLSGQGVDDDVGDETITNGQKAMSVEEAEEFLSKMEKESRFKQETWS